MFTQAHPGALGLLPLGTGLKGTYCKEDQKGLWGGGSIGERLPADLRQNDRHRLSPQISELAPARSSRFSFSIPPPPLLSASVLSSLFLSVSPVLI